MLWFQEEDVLDMLAQCEADEKDGKAITTNRLPRGPKVSSHSNTVSYSTWWTLFLSVLVIVAPTYSANTFPITSCFRY